MGTPYYMSPEQCRGRDVDHRTDVYSFGIMVYQMLTGQLPFTGQDFMEILMKQISENPVPASQLVPEIPAEVDKILNWMMAKDSVRSRFEDRTHGISYTEFSYMLLQAYDFYRLFEDRGCRLQMGASDQWGNITAGIELIRRKTGKEAYGLTCALLLTSSGEKFGKSAGNAVWLDAGLTSPHSFYQFWFNQPDDKVESLLKAFTFLTTETIDETVKAARTEDAGRRLLQRKLAYETTKFVHGEDAASQGERCADLRQGKLSLREIGVAEEIFGAFEGVPRTDFTKAPLLSIPLRMLFMHPNIGLIPSASEWRRQLAQGAIYVNDERVVPRTGEEPRVKDSDILYGKVVVLRRGKKDYALVRVVDEPS